MQELARQRTRRLLDALAEEPFDGAIAASPANVLYATGYRSVAGRLFRQHQMAAVVADDGVTLVAPVADTAPAIDAGVDPDAVVAFGRFYFESASDEPAAPTRLVDEHPSFVDALVAAVHRARLAEASLGVDVKGLGVHWPAVHDALGGAELDDASDWFSSVRAVKLVAEIDLLRRAARLTETGIDRAVEVAGRGVTEVELARVVAGTIVAGGGTPEFVVVTAGLRSALADADPADNRLAPGDLLRFDVGCTIDGYWSDMARTAVLGDPDAAQAERYAAILAGEAAQLELLRPGVPAADLFAVAVETVEKHGLSPYRRHHCGHAIGTDVYEPPIVAPGHDTPVEPGMTFCLETPFYELGWGGMMVEDTVVVTEGGHERFTVSDRSLRVIPL